MNNQRSFRIKSLGLGLTEFLKRDDQEGRKNMFPQMVILVLVFVLVLKELFFVPNCDRMVWIEYLLIS